MRRIVTLMTDFGTSDGYVAELTGVILSHAPDAMVVDVSHDVPAHDVEHARLALARYWRRYPVGTVHVVVVDPGVGSPRAALAVQSEGVSLVGPDNGVLSPALLAPGARAVSLAVPPAASATFHGRDVFAPAAAALLNGTGIDALGAPLIEPVIRRTAPALLQPDGMFRGQVISVDRFGNAITNLLGVHGGTVLAGGRALPLRRTYADVSVGELVALCGSNGLIEIACRDGRAAAVLGLGRGSPVLLRPEEGQRSTE